MFQKIGEVHFRLLGTNGCYLRAKNERVTAACSGCRQNLKYENFTWSFGRQPQKFAPKKRAARAVRLFSVSVFIQLPIKSLIWALSMPLPSSFLKHLNAIMTTSVRAVIMVLGRSVTQAFYFYYVPIIWTMPHHWKKGYINLKIVIPFSVSPFLFLKPPFQFPALLYF